MSEITLECKGLPCPQPVLKCKESIEDFSPEQIAVTVDNEAAKENVSRFLTVHGYEVKAEEKDADFVVTGHKENAGECKECAVMTDNELADVDKQKILVFIATDTIGVGDDALGASLMYNFLVTLKELGDELWRIVMLNGGVKLAISDNKCLDELKKLEESGVSILVCGTCLEHFGLTGQREVGQVTNMLDVVTSFQLATKTIRV
ncbi:sulfurtransferase-like selenium metabolism protein YedF [Pseudodesulfovibrio sediminis]|uniref:UPF0033 domain-containing protein n=1 Tax=Pseudodesulfovibrio sediminis TaxID=2810563 RepID=A0ABM7P2Z7_9BACT|nr:sulfurtransferase-like selenium metabolism protein YedF [Pseudodesulfovibrio sediminis]BCS87147.1 hypothetical protein PSDVSF_03890 [Pseudodesulfovibrio sediminis]